MVPSMELRLRQHFALTPQLQQALRLLQLSALEFNQEIDEAVGTNPFLEEENEGRVAGSAEGADQATRFGTEPETTSLTPAPEHDEEAGLRGGLEETPRSSSSHSGRETDWTEWSEAPTTLRDHLREQLTMSQVGERDRILAQLIIDALDDDGYLKIDLDELVDMIDPTNEVKAEDLKVALRLVQSLEPPGIAARTLQECLSLQLDALPAHTPGVATARALVADHLSLLANREFIRLQQFLHCNENELHTARALIRTLDPKPGLQFGADEIRYVIPDVIVNKVRGRWTAQINPAVQPRVRINRAYAEVASSRNNSAPLLNRQLQEARWLIRNMEQRFHTIQRVAESIVGKQKTFFEYGELAMKPLALKDIASELSLHESTVCRVTNGKYMSTPRGVFEFKHFFSRQLPTEGGGACSTTAIRALLKKMIASESPGNPLSDAQLARLLASQGLKVARRTVTKYRTLMRVPSVELRRVMGSQQQSRAEHMSRAEQHR